MSKKTSWYPVWFPYPGSWISAVLLWLLSIGIGVVVWLMTDFGAYLTERSRQIEPIIVFGINAALSPVVLIAFFHHFLHKVVGRLFPSIQAPEVGETKGIIPGLISWWEGFFSWAILWIATLVSIEAIVIARPVLGVSWSTLIDPNYFWSFGNRQIDIIAGVGWLGTAAYLYQLQYLIEQRLLRARLLEKGQKLNR